MVSTEKTYTSVCKSVQKYCGRITDADQCRVFYVLDSSCLEVFSGDPKVMQVPMGNDIVSMSANSACETFDTNPIENY